MMSIEYVYVSMNNELLIKNKEGLGWSVYTIQNIKKNRT